MPHCWLLELQFWRCDCVIGISICNSCRQRMRNLVIFVFPLLDDVPKWESEFVFLPSTTQFSVTISLPNVTNARTTHYNVQYRQVLVSNAYGAWQTLIVIVGVNARATLSCLSQGSQYEVRAQFLDGSTAISLHSAVRTFWTTLNSK